MKKEDEKGGRNRPKRPRIKKKNPDFYQNVLRSSTAVRHEGGRALKLRRRGGSQNGRGPVLKLYSRDRELTWPVRIRKGNGGSTGSIPKRLPSNDSSVEEAKKKTVRSRTAAITAILGEERKTTRYLKERSECPFLQNGKKKKKTWARTDAGGGGSRRGARKRGHGL